MGNSLSLYDIEIPIKELVSLIEEVAEKEMCTVQEAVRLLKDAYVLKGKFRHLTRRERDIAILAAWGASVNETAEKLFLAPNTVQSYRHRIHHKLDIPTGVHLKAHLNRVLYGSEI
jgi:DNA-binding NarL/FixJ family response regulator